MTLSYLQMGALWCAGSVMLAQRAVGKDAGSALPILLLASTAMAATKPGATEFALVQGVVLGAFTLRELFSNTFKDAYHNPLTGIKGRRSMENALRALPKRYVLANLDVDFFKKFNDTYGHDVGDDVLKMVAKQIDGVAGGGQAYHWGGEEFTILFKNTDQKSAYRHLEAVRKSVESYQLALRNEESRPKDHETGRTRRGAEKARQKTVSVTISIGVADASYGDGKPERVLKLADDALYASKDSGRNRVTMYSKSIPSKG